MTFLLDHDTPDDIAYSLNALGHQAVFLRDVLAEETEDESVLAHAHKQGWVIITCNRDDYLALARSRPHHGLIILIRRKTRVAERVALIRLLDRAGESGIRNNINFA
jgi:predicted nuclease of predicted toxin-antitoxin system